MKRWCWPVFLLLCCPATGLAAEARRPADQSGALPEVQTSAPRGFYDGPFRLELRVPFEGAVIRYTLDGAEPTMVGGMNYGGPLQITNTTVLRAAAFKAGAPLSSVTTHTYLFLDQVIHQPRNPPGLPAGPRAWNGFSSAYEMDARVVGDPLYRGQIKEALRSLPVLSIVCKSEDLFGGRTGIYLNSMQRGETWEKSCSAELILADGSTGFQVDCGIRIQGNQNRVPVKSPKHSFRLLFKEKFGPSKLHYQMFPDSPVNKFDTLVLRADYNNSWIHWDEAARPRAQRTRDAWLKDSQRAMGWMAGHNRYLHLYLNGLYWGVYDAAERPDASFAASYWGGSKDDYDVINEFQIKDGTMDIFNAMYAMRGLANNSQYEQLQEYLNVTEFIDYLLLNYYAGNQDIGEEKNWYAIRPRKPGGVFHYIVWDGEQILHDVTDDTVNDPAETPFRLGQNLAVNAEYKLAFADRVQKHCFNDGALTPGETAARWMKRAGEVSLAMIAESARWGYYRRRLPSTRDKEWLTEQRRLLAHYFPQRTRTVLEQLRTAGLYPKISAPHFSQQRTSVPPGVQLSMTAEDDGTIYYTTNGADPRVYGTGIVSTNAQTYAAAVPMAGFSTVKARVLKAGIWSALTEASLTNAATERKR